MNQQSVTDITSEDKLWAALCYALVGIAHIILLFMDDKRKRAFIHAHYIQSLVAGIVIGVVGSILATIVAAVTLGIGAICAPIILLAGWAVLLFWAYKAYQGQMVEIPFVTKFCKGQGWA